jgi:hypothetical protein
VWIRTFVVAALLVGLYGCIEQSPLPVVFDQVIESTTFSNRLLAPVVLYRNGVILDTLPRLATRTYQIGEKGVFEHAWRLISPRSPSGAPYGEEPFVDLGIQYNIRESIDIRNQADGGTLFTPRIFNATFVTIQLAWVNFREFDERFVGMPIFPNQSTSIDHAPYYYWNTSSNVVIDDQVGFRVWIASREDTNAFGEPQLELTNEAGFFGTGATEPLVIF